MNIMCDEQWYGRPRYVSIVAEKHTCVVLYANKVDDQCIKRSRPRNARLKRESLLAFDELTTERESYNGQE